MSNRILIIEDDISICEMVINYLIGEGFTVDAFQDGGAAVRTFGDGSGYSLALVDLMLPDMSGMEVIKSILDEPINALDPEGIKEMRALFRRLNQEQGTTILISSHILSEVEQIADTVGILQKGRLLKEIAMSDIRRYQTDYIELEVEDVKRAAYLLEHVLNITGFKVISDTVIEIYDIRKYINEITTILIQNSVCLMAIGRKQSSLEDYFFQVIEEVQGSVIFIYLRQMVVASTENYQENIRILLAAGAIALAGMWYVFQRKVMQLD